MSKNEITMIVAITLAVWLAVFFSSGCTIRPKPPTNLKVTSQPKTTSWDQENLKSHDNSCATAIYWATDLPAGDLYLCP
jgi:hypothetical protein